MTRDEIRERFSSITFGRGAGRGLPSLRASRFLVGPRQLLDFTPQRSIKGIVKSLEAAFWGRKASFKKTMPRVNRHFLPGYLWHITRRCHQRQFLLKFARDRYLYWLFEAKKRYRQCVLDYIVTSNHVHLLVQDMGEDVIAQGMQLIAGRTAQEYNERKNRHGRFGRTVITPRRSKPMNTCIAVSFTSTSIWFAPAQSTILPNGCTAVTVRFKDRRSDTGSSMFANWRHCAALRI
jgi:REP element-mobilizing transposase RayT